MTHGYRTLQHWNLWLTQQFLGQELLRAEQEFLTGLLHRSFGRYSLTIGVPHQSELLKPTSIPCQSLMGPLVHPEKTVDYIEGSFHELPIITGSVDIVLLPHCLEFTDNPRRLLTDACRIVKPEGLIIICGFNPYSAWGLRKLMTKNKKVPWSANFIQSTKIKNWLRLADFELEQEKTIMHRLPIDYETLYRKFNFVETLGRKCLPRFGGVYVLLARAKVIPLTPIRLKWKQRLTHVRISPTSGYIQSFPAA